MQTTTVYKFKYRHKTSGEWLQTRCRFTIEEAHKRYGASNCFPLEWTKAERVCNESDGDLTAGAARLPA